MNNDAAQVLAHRLISAGFAVELQPGTYNLIYSLDNYVEDGVWDSDLSANEDGRVELPNGTTISASNYDRFTAMFSNTQISGANHGFMHGVSLFTDAELGDTLNFLRDHSLIRARLTFAEGGLLIGATALADAVYYGSSPCPQIALDYRNNLFSLDVFGFNAEDTCYAVVTPDAGIIDVYDAPGEIVTSR